MEQKFNSRKLVSYVISGTLYIMLFLVVSGILLEVATRQNHIALFNSISLFFSNMGVSFMGLFYSACITVCASPFVSAIVFIVGDIINKNYKATLLGMLLLIALSISLVYAILI